MLPGHVQRRGRSGSLLVQVPPPPFCPHAWPHEVQPLRQAGVCLSVCLGLRLLLSALAHQVTEPRLRESIATKENAGASRPASVGV